MSERELPASPAYINLRGVEYAASSLEIGYGYHVVMPILFVLVILTIFMGMPVLLHLAALAILAGLAVFLYHAKRTEQLIESGVIPRYQNPWKTALARGYRTYLDAIAYNDLLDRWNQYLRACELGFRERMPAEDGRQILERFRVLREQVDRDIQLFVCARSIRETDANTMSQGTQTFIRSNDLHDLPTRLRVEPDFGQRPDDDTLAAIREVDALLKAKER